MSWWNIVIFRLNIYHSLYTDITLIFRWSIGLEGKVKGQIWHDILKLLTVLFICWQYTPHVSTPSQSFIRICSNVIITDRKHVCQCSQKHNFLIRDKNNVVFSGFAFFTKCVPVPTVRGSHSFTGHQSFQNTFMSGKSQFLCLQMVYIGGSDTIKWLN